MAVPCPPGMIPGTWQHEYSYDSCTLHMPASQAHAITRSPVATWSASGQACRRYSCQRHVCLHRRYSCQRHVRLHTAQRASSGRIS
jgi:hypothetical protein